MTDAAEVLDPRGPLPDRNTAVYDRMFAAVDADMAAAIIGSQIGKTIPTGQKPIAHAMFLVASSAVDQYVNNPFADYEDIPGVPVPDVALPVEVQSAVIILAAQFYVFRLPGMKDQQVGDAKVVLDQAWHDSVIGSLLNRWRINPGL